MEKEISRKQPISQKNMTLKDILEKPSDSIIEKVLPFSEKLFCEKDGLISIKDSKIRGFYYVEKGTIEVSYKAQETKIVVALIGSGSFFGEIGFFDGISRVRDIRATEDTDIRLFDQKSLDILQNDDPILYGNFMVYMAQFICAKFRRILEDQNPMSGFADSLTTGHRKMKEEEVEPDEFFKTPEGQSVYKIVDDIKNDFFNISYRLQKDTTSAIPEEIQEESDELLNKFNESLPYFKSVGGKAKVEGIVWNSVFKEIFPYLMRSRMAERAYFKPKGYAGDFLMIDMIYKNQPDGDGKLGKIVDGWVLKSIPALAVRGRRELLSRQLGTLCSSKSNKTDAIHIMNLACGPSRELFDFISHCEYSELIQATCVDIDQQALEYTDSNAKAFPHNATIRLMKENVIKWALGRASHNFELQDIIYSSGLTDYLEKKLFLSLINQCYKQLKPGGTLMIGNFAPNPGKLFMDHILEWKLICRSEKEIKDLFASSLFGDHVDVIAEEQQINLFAVARKEAEA